MDNTWHSEWVLDGPIDQENASTCFKKTITCYRYEGNAVDSPSMSKDDSLESCTGEHAEKGDANIAKPTFKSILQAKKRLQAFSVTKQLKRNSKDEKTEDLDKSDKMLPKKSKKALYPLDKAQAVVQEIEEIKQKEAQEAQQEKKKIDAIMAVAYKTLALKEALRVRSRSPSSEREQQFKKREIKSRNYRRSDSFKRRSVSPDNYSRKAGKLVYPRNWTEYKENGMTFVKDEELKSKIFPKIKLNAHELIAKVLTFDGPSPLIESFKSLTSEEKIENIPMSFLRITRSKPTLTYSVNSRKNRDSFVTRKQLFHVIPRDRRNAIEKLINSASSRSQFQSRTLTSRLWYSKSWKRSADAECKILENSVGLSFLQTYSDEEEENDFEEIVNFSNTKENEAIPELEAPIKEATLNHHSGETEFSAANSDNTRRELEERDTLTPEEKPGVLENKQKEEILEEVKVHQKEEEQRKKRKKERSEENKKCLKEKGETVEKTVRHSDNVKSEETKKMQKENILEEIKKKEKDELSETRKAIKELEEELERRKAIRIEEEKVTKKKKKRKSKRKGTSSEFEEEEKPVKKKRKRVNPKKNKHSTESDVSSSEYDKTKKFKRKSKRRKHKITKKKNKAKKMKPPTKEDTIKKTEENEGSDSDERKKKKSEIEVDCEMASAGTGKTKKKIRGKSNENLNLEESQVKKKKPPRQDDEDSKMKTGSCDFLEEIQLLDDLGRSEEIGTDRRGSTKPRWNSREHTDKHEGDSDVWSDRRQKDSRNSRNNSETSTKSYDCLKKQRDVETNDDRKRPEKPKDKYRYEEEQLYYKMETEQERKSTKQLAKNDKCEAGDKAASKNRRSSEDVEKKIVPREREESRDRRHGTKSETQQESKRKLGSLSTRNEPDWKNLKNKRTRYRHKDYDKSVEIFPNEFEGFPLEEDLYFPKETNKDSGRSKDGGKCEIGTPDTEEYRENWEKDSYPIWESDEDAPIKAREKLNSSWESDEEIFERGHQITEKSRPLGDTLTLDLEIPLNIKPFKRREVIDPDAELRLLKRQSLSLSEERRRLEIEKLRVKELELEVVKEVKGKVRADKKPKRRRSKDKETEERESMDKKRDAVINDCLENEAVARKKGRWDKRNSSPKMPIPNLELIHKIKKEVIDDEDSSTNVSSSTSINNSAILENEYEEFMKALTSSPKKPQIKNKTKKEEYISDTPRCLTPLSGCVKTCATATPADIESSVKAQVTKNVSDEVGEHVPIIPTQHAPQIVTILPKDIPLIPMPLPKEIKPVPVPSPQIEIDKIPKPLINLSLSANITLDIAPKFTTPPVASPATAANALQALATHSPIVQTLGKIASEKDSASPSADTSLDSFKEQVNEKSEVEKSTSKPFVFTSMVLPSKRLLNNSNLNLGDSDDDEKLVKPLKKLEDIMEESKSDGTKMSSDKDKMDTEAEKAEVDTDKGKEAAKDTRKHEKKEQARSRTPQDKEGRRKRSPDRHVRRDGSPRRFSRGKREISPRRRSRDSPRRRGHSPKRHSPRRRSPLKRRSPGKRRHSPRSPSPKTRRRSSISPRQKSSPRRSPSPKFRPSSPKKAKSKSPERHSFKSLSERSVTKSNKPKSPVTSPLEGLKRSVADSTISDDLLPQPSMNIEEFTHSPVTQFYDRTLKTLESPKRESLDVRIDQVLGLANEQPQPIPTTYSNYNYNQFAQFNKVAEPKSNLVSIQQTFGKITTQQSKSNFVQVGNMVQILPTEDMTMIQADKTSSCHISTIHSDLPPVPKPVVKNEKSQIVQVGNMLQIVPADLPLEPPLPAEPKSEVEEQTAPASSPPLVFYEKQSAESTMRLKVAERREEREKRRQEREKRRKEKEKRRKEKEKQRQLRLKQRTENMIKRALELEAEGLEEERDESIVNEAPTQWPPLPALVSSLPYKEAGKGILVRASVKGDLSRVERRKVVQFADGVRPGEGTSPSGGEELSSPPPRKKLPKEKRYKKTKLQKKNQKKKVKVKIIKKRPETEESDEDDGLPPPSPPPGSPPPHIFPPRMKPQPQPAINNIQPYLPNVVSIQTSHSHQQLFRSPQLNLIMHPHHGPPPPPHHHVPPPPPHHHGPPLPPGPPHFHHGPPPPPPHHHGPPPPPPHHHGPPPPPGLGRPRLPPFFPLRPRPHHHHGPPPPFHR
ncbi:titin-like [Anoplophora glabripennis]|uniref:titin-like n=1 Tax=Anoplophora glabripennis TaxID=217634 RepID=UPI000874DB85|nr:titin-like [Anoplophora glabripennis]